MAKSIKAPSRATLKKYAKPIEWDEAMHIVDWFSFDSTGTLKLDLSDTVYIVSGASDQLGIAITDQKRASDLIITHGDKIIAIHGPSPSLRLMKLLLFVPDGVTLEATMRGGYLNSSPSHKRTVLQLLGSAEACVAGDSIEARLYHTAKLDGQVDGGRLHLEMHDNTSVQINGTYSTITVRAAGTSGGCINGDAREEETYRLDRDTSDLWRNGKKIALLLPRQGTIRNGDWEHPL
jgi:hypothetical protein